MSSRMLLRLLLTDADDEETTYRRVAASKQVDAVYVSSPRSADRRIALLQQLGLPYLVHGRSEGLDFAYPYMDIDNEAAFRDAGRLLLQLGHKRIGLINGETNETFAIFRERGLSQAMAAAGLTLPASFVRSQRMTDEAGYRAARGLLEAGRPTAIVCSSLIMSLGVFRAVHDLGLRIPDDISVIAHDDVFPWLKPENFSVPLTTTRSSIRAAGTRVAERLAARIAGRETEPFGEVWPVELIVRGSVAAAGVPAIGAQPIRQTSPSAREDIRSMTLYLLMRSIVLAEAMARPGAFSPPARTPAPRVAGQTSQG
mgnify:CR=1 FL=1